MFMENRPAAVAEMRRVLAPSGRLVINTPGRIPPFFEALERAIVEQISADLGGFVSAVFSMHDPDDLAGLLRDAGLRDVSSTVLTTTLRLPAPAEFLWQYIGLTPMAAFIEQAPNSAKSALERQFAGEAQKQWSAAYPWSNCPWSSRPHDTDVFGGSAVGNRYVWHTATNYPSRITTSCPSPSCGIGSVRSTPAS